MNQIIIRSAKEEDAESILRIYAPYILETAITYEYDVPSLEEFKGRIRQILSKYPYLIAMKGNQVLGYAYASTFKGRRAYDCSVETSIYIQKDLQRNGIGKMLYKELERQLKAIGITNMYACIAYKEEEDEYLTLDSVHFHEAMGFRLCGTFTDCAIKFSRTYSMVWMEKFI